MSNEELILELVKLAKQQVTVTDDRKLKYRDKSFDLPQMNSHRPTSKRAIKIR
jgi:hypothetical protein